MKPTLLILAAGMGSRYGSLKQMDGIGPNKEAILDYSVYDAVRAGFGKVVFVIRNSFFEDFKEVFNKERFGGKIEVEYVFQELDTLPEGFTVPEGREKPWGTNHALMMGKSVINEPFAAINADDFYGADAYKVIAEYLKTLEGKKGNYCMVGYQVKNTLSEYGSVSRGVCTANESGDLVSIVERTQIEKNGGQIVFKDDNGEFTPIEGDSLVSMNFFGFTPDYFEYSDELFGSFLTENSANLKAEFFIPLVTNTLINSGKATLKVLSSDAKWFGVTYKEDRPQVVKQLTDLINAGFYPEKLWE
ncbi:MAG: sugar phosphate nucleotidyltransferase [Rikenellaceae bacterium]